MENKSTVEVHRELGSEHVNRVINILQTLKDEGFGTETNKFVQTVISVSDGMLDLLEFSLKKGWSADDLFYLAKTIIALHDK